MSLFFTEQNFTKALEETIKPTLLSCRHECTFNGYDQKPLYAVQYTANNPRGTVFILHGFSETADKYLELIYYFLQQNLSVLIYDQRGHGRSPRTAPLAVTHIDRFEEYVEDFESCISAFSDTLPHPFYLYAHSMGGAVAALYLEKGTDVFKKAVLSSPMIAPRHDGLFLWVSLAVCRLSSLFGKSKRCLFVAKKDYSTEPFEQSSALSRARFEAYRALRRENEMLRGGSPTYGWSLVSLGVTKHILKKDAPERIRTPFRIYAAELDHLVRREPQQSLAARAPKGEFVMVPQCKHEIYAASDEILHPHLAELLDYFQVNAAKKRV